jgi:hypothetical protein
MTILAKKRRQSSGPRPLIVTSTFRSRTRRSTGWVTNQFPTLSKEIIMSSPFDAGRDSNMAGGNAFDDEADVADSHLGAFRSEAMRVSGDKLNEDDYRG